MAVVGRAIGDFIALNDSCLLHPSVSPSIGPLGDPAVCHQLDGSMLANRRTLLRLIRAQRFVGASGLLSFDANGDRLGQFAVANQRRTVAGLMQTDTSVAVVGAPAVISRSLLNCVVAAVFDPNSNFSIDLASVVWPDGTANVPLDRESALSFSGCSLPPCSELRHSSTRVVAPIAFNVCCQLCLLFSIAGSDAWCCFLKVPGFAPVHPFRCHGSRSAPSLLQRSATWPAGPSPPCWNKLSTRGEAPARSDCGC